MNLSCAFFCGTLNVTVPSSSPLLVTPSTSLELCVGVALTNPSVPSSLCIQKPAGA